MSPSIVRALRRSILVPTTTVSRRELVTQLETLDAQHSESARRRDDAIRVAEQDEALWREPARRLLDVRAGAAREAAAEAAERQRVEAQLRGSPPARVRQFEDWLTVRRLEVNRDPVRHTAAVGEELVRAIVWLRDEAWKLDDDDAARECERHRRAIEDTIAEARRPKADDEDGAA